MSNEPNKPIEAEELTEKELEGIVGGTMGVQDVHAASLEKVQSELQESLKAKAALKVQILGS